MKQTTGAGLVTRRRLVVLGMVAGFVVAGPTALAVQPLPAAPSDARSVTLPDVAAKPVPLAQAILAGPPGSWSVGGSTGSFNYQVPIAVPEAIGGRAPSVALAYDSGSVDGRLASTTNQGSWVGDGWDYQPGFIARAYLPCKDVPGASAAAKASSEQCWGGQALSLSLGGHNRAMVLDDATGLWHLSSDNGEKVERLTGAVNGVWSGEYWRLTTTDGTQYYFGLNHLPLWATGNATTNSAWPSRIYAATSADNCYNATSFATSFCAAAWRWNLDYVVDTNGNATSYTYGTETGNYKPNGATTATASYVRAGHLSRIDYGMRSDSIYTKPAPVQVSFATANRCFTAACATHTAVNWPDAPWNQDCAAAATCAVTSPTFWTTLRLATVSTQVLKNAGTLPAAYATADTYALTQRFIDPGDGTSPQLWLDSVAHTGTDGGSVTLPSISFTPQQLANRIDTSGAWPTMIHNRIGWVTTGLGSSIVVRYSAPECTTTHLPATPETNTLRCFPAFWTPPLTTTPIRNWFNRYVVTAVTENDDAAAGPAKATSYTYVGPAAWHYDDNETVAEAYRTYGQWRGYAQVQTRMGALGDALTRSDSWFYRGMNGDQLPTGSRSAMVSGPPGSPTNLPDDNQFSGVTREVLTYLGDTSTVTTDVVTDESSVLTGSRVRAALPSQTASMVHAASVTTTLTAPKLASGKRTTKTTYSYDVHGQVTQSDETGNAATTGDERCTQTTFATPAVGLYVYNRPQEIEIDGATCAAATVAGFNKAAGAVSDERTIYDGHAFAAPVTAGVATSTLQAKGWTAGSGFSYLTRATTSTDVYGRPLTTTNPTTGLVSSRTYTPTAGATASVGHCCGYVP